jgi:ATP-dependent Clp protease ATP-binding subunit ClpB
MTTNAGSDRKDGAVGFNRSINELGKEKAMKALNDFLRPEFINRVDEIVYFNQLSEEDFKSIANLMLGELSDTMAERSIELVYDDSLIDYLTTKSYSLAYGARNLRRLIQKEVEDKIAAEIIEHYAHPFKRIGVTAARGEIQILAT